jgi:hypothetical protein
MSVMKTYAVHCRCQHTDHETAKAHIKAHIMAPPQQSSNRQTGRQKTYTNPHHLVHTAAGRFEDGFQIAAALGRLLGDGAFDQVALGVGGDLTSTPDLAGGFDGLTVWSCCCLWEEEGLVSGRMGELGMDCVD